MQRRSVELEYLVFGLAFLLFVVVGFFGVRTLWSSSARGGGAQVSRGTAPGGQDAPEGGNLAGSRTEQAVGELPAVQMSETAPKRRSAVKSIPSPK